MDLHRAAFKLESSTYVPSSMSSPALMVLASTAESDREPSVIPCHTSRPFGVPVSLEKDLHLPFPGGSYTFSSVYQRQGGFTPRDFPASLLHLHPQFTPAPLSMLGHGAVGAFRPFASPNEDRDTGIYHSAFLPTKRLKGGPETDTSPRLRYTIAEGKDFEFGVNRLAPVSPGGLKGAEDSGKKRFSLSGLLLDAEASCSPEEQKDGSARQHVNANKQERLRFTPPAQHIAPAPSIHFDFVEKRVGGTVRRTRKRSSLRSVIGCAERLGGKERLGSSGERGGKKVSAAFHMKAARCEGWMRSDGLDMHVNGKNNND
ncbi:E3 ubiquitin-protein ligase RNF220 isoform X1 [Tachysurus ichikawai]